MEGFAKRDKSRDKGGRNKKEIYSKVIRAGRRTYFIDVKSTREKELYLTITESKKRYENEGRFHYEKHKIFLYKEDFRKFVDNLQQVVDYIFEKQPDDYYKEEPVTDELEAEEVEESIEENVSEEIEVKDYTNVEFEDLSN